MPFLVQLPSISLVVVVVVVVFFFFFFCKTNSCTITFNNRVILLVVMIKHYWGKWTMCLVFLAQGCRFSGNCLNSELTSWLDFRAWLHEAQIPVRLFIFSPFWRFLAQIHTPFQAFSLRSAYIPVSDKFPVRKLLCNCWMSRMQIPHVSQMYWQPPAVMGMVKCKEPRKETVKGFDV